MTRYKKILLAIDFFPDGKQVIEKAVQMAEDHDAEILLIHVCEPMVTAYPADGISGWGPQMSTLQTEVRNDARKKLDEVAGKLKVKEANTFLRDGKASSEIHQVAEENKVDLIVLGTHGQHGIQLILGSTANSVIHGVSCDVLAVRIHERSSQ
ncbi:MAG: universal stress protein [Pseudomonadales bacterium]